MKRIIIKNVAIVLIMLLTVSFSIPVISLAEAAAKGGWDLSGEIDTISGEATIAGATGAEMTAAKRIVTAILNIVKIVAVGVALIMLTVLAVKYIMAAPGDKADIKKHAVVYVIGAVVLFGAAGILQIIESFATSNIGGTGTATE